MEDSTQKIFVVDFVNKKHGATYEISGDVVNFTYFDTRSGSVRVICSKIEKSLKNLDSEVA